jgi:hypothetical protein
MTTEPILQELDEAMTEARIHFDESGYRGNCANVAVALYDIALEDFDDDRFRFVVIDRPFHWGHGPDHVAVEYNGKYLDSKGIHSRSELLDIVGNKEGNEAVMRVEDRKYIVTHNAHFEQQESERLKEKIRNNIETVNSEL